VERPALKVLKALKVKKALKVLKAPRANLAATPS
jgi:hypothetical protein